MILLGVSVSTRDRVSASLVGCVVLVVSLYSLQHVVGLPPKVRGHLHPYEGEAALTMDERHPNSNDTQL